MSSLDALILGVVQGLTEFLPVSSKGHLVIGETLLGVRLESLTFEILVHVATLSAVLVVLRPEVWRLLRERDWEYVLKLALACVPVGLAGFLLRERVEAVFHEPFLTGLGLLFTGCVLFAIRWRARGELRAPTWLGALALGCAQVLALMPGVSRSGMTISAALAAGVAGTAAAQFSFLVSLPVIAAAGALQAWEVAGAGGPGEVSAGGGADALGGSELAIAFAAAFVSGIVAIRLVYRVLGRHRFSDFAFYCWPAGLLFLLYLTLR